MVRQSNPQRSGTMSFDIAQRQAGSQQPEPLTAIGTTRGTSTTGCLGLHPIGGQVKTSDPITLRSKCANSDRQTSGSGLSSVQRGHEAGIALLAKEANEPRSWQSPGPEEMTDEAQEPDEVLSKRALKANAKQAKVSRMKGQAPRTRKACTEVQQQQTVGPRPNRLSFLLKIQQMQLLQGSRSLRPS